MAFEVPKYRIAMAGHLAKDLVMTFPLRVESAEMNFALEKEPMLDKEDGYLSTCMKREIIPYSLLTLKYTHAGFFQAESIRWKSSGTADADRAIARAAKKHWKPNKRMYIIEDDKAFETFRGEEYQDALTDDYRLVSGKIRPRSASRTWGVSFNELEAFIDGWYISSYLYSDEKTLQQWFNALSEKYKPGDD